MEKKIIGRKRLLLEVSWNMMNCWMRLAVFKDSREEAVCFVESNTPTNERVVVQ
jgi:hypothetical protein